MELKNRVFDEKKYFVLSEYEKLLLGEKKKFAIGNSGLSGNYIASLWWEYALKRICHWDCEQTLAFLDDEIVDQLKLRPSFQYIDADKRPHLSKHMSYEFIAALVYPKEMKYTHIRRTIDEYEKVNKLGVYKNDPNTYTYSKGFWAKNPENAAICLGYCVQNFLNFDNEYELYKYFAEPTGMEFICTHNLLDAFNKSVDATVLDFFYYSLNHSVRNEFMYHLVKHEQEQAKEEDARKLKSENKGKGE